MKRKTIPCGAKGGRARGKIRKRHKWKTDGRCEYCNRFYKDCTYPDRWAEIERYIGR